MDKDVSATAAKLATWSQQAGQSSLGPAIAIISLSGTRLTTFGTGRSRSPVAYATDAVTERFAAAVAPREPIHPATAADRADYVQPAAKAGREEPTGVVPLPD